MKKNYVFLISLIISTVSFGQDTIENFDYGSTDNNLINVGSNWLNISGSGGETPQVGYAAISLTMPDYEPIAIGGSATLNIASQPGQFGEDLHLDIARPASTETVYLSALVNVTFARAGGLDYFLHLNTGAYMGTDVNGDPIYNNENDRARVFVRDDGSGGINFGILSAGESADVSWDANSYAKATTYLIVAAYEIASGTSKLYVLTAPVTNEPGQANALHQFTGLLEITAVSLRQKAYTPSATIDGLRVTTSWTDLINTSLETVSIPDTNFENYLETHNAIGEAVALGDSTSMGDGIQNNLTLKSKVETVTSLNVNDSNIASLQGIEAFTNLEVLYCQRNQLTELNVSQNTALTNLECESNQFTMLDVSNNAALKVLGCAFNNLSSLDLSKNLLLDLIWINNNNIQSLNLDVNTALRGFGISNNPLVYMSIKNGNNTNISYIEAMNIPSLSCIQVDDANAVTYLSTNFGFVDSSVSFSADCGTVYIPDSNFENYLETHSANGDVVSLGDATSMGDGVLNNLTLISKVDTVTNLNVNDSNIASLQGIEAFTNLETLYCQRNQLERLDVSKNLALSVLECESNQFSTLDVSNNIALKVLGCALNNLSSLDVSNNLLLEAIWFTNNNITRLNLDVNTALRTYGLSSNPLVYMSIKNGNNVNMSYLEAQNLPTLTCIKVDDENAAYLSQNNWFVDPSISFSNDCGDFWTVYTSDTNVDAALSSYGNAIDTSGDGEITLNEAAAYTGALDLSNQDITDIAGLQAFTSVTEINLSGNNILDLSVLFGSNAVVLTNKQAQFKTVNTSSFSGLLTLDVSNNNLKSLDVSSITTLVNLNCSNNALQRLNVKNANNTNFTSFNATGNTDLYCIVVDDPVYANSNFSNIDSQSNFSDSNCNATLISKVFFQGPYDASTGLMKDVLRNNGLIPTSSPYADGKTTVSTVLDVSGNDAIIDWVWVEIRNGTNGLTVLESSSALIQADGDIVDIDGISPLEFTMPVGNYYVMVSHRNHLGVLTNGTAALSGITMDSDLTSDSNSVIGGGNAIMELGNGKFALFAGDFNGDGQIQNTDKSAVEPLRGVSGYTNADVDMNGEVQNADLNSVLNPNLGKGQQYMSKLLNAKRKK